MMIPLEICTARPNYHKLHSPDLKMRPSLQTALETPLLSLLWRTPTIQLKRVIMTKIIGLPHSRDLKLESVHGKHFSLPSVTKLALLSQRAFHERKARHIRELETKSVALGNNTSTLIEGNECLKLQVPKKDTKNEVLDLRHVWPKTLHIGPHK